jgi:hypothetical protein
MSHVLFILITQYNADASLGSKNSIVSVLSKADNGKLATNHECQEATGNL